MFDNVAQAVGNTPLVALDRLAKGLPGRVAVKLEYFSPGGSIKDRPALTVIEEAEKAGVLRKGQYVVEKTSGNMGGGLAWACAVKGYKFIAVLSAGNTPERSRMIRAFGARVELVPQVKGGKPGRVSREDLEQVEVRTAELTRKYKAFRPDQFNNPGSVLAHEKGTGPEIWKQTGGKITHFVSFVGSSGSLIGTAKALKARNAGVLCYAAEPVDAQFLAGKKIKSTSHTIQGGGYSLRPGVYDETLVDGTIPITDAEALRTARSLASIEGIMGGFSTGANVAAALKLARKAKRGSLIVTLCCDTGLKYLSTDLYR
jgi:cysteine synthase A